MRKKLLVSSLFIPLVVLSGGGALVELKSKLAFDFDNVTERRQTKN